MIDALMLECDVQVDCDSDTPEDDSPEARADRLRMEITLYHNRSNRCPMSFRVVWFDLVVILSSTDITLVQTDALCWKKNCKRRWSNSRKR